MGSETDEEGPPAIIIDECLCFITNKYSYVDLETVIKLCVEYFEENEIEASKDLLYNSLHTISNSTAFVKRRNASRSDSKSVKNIRDIWMLLQEIGDAPSPKFVAHDLGKLPPIGFDNIDVTVLFKKIQDSNVTISFLKDTIATLDESNKSLCGMFTSLESRIKHLEKSDTTDKNDDITLLLNKSVKDSTSSDPETKINGCDKPIDGLLGAMPYACTECDNKYSTCVELNNHKTAHVDKVLPTFSCPAIWCDYKAETNIELTTHKLTHSHRKYICDVHGCVFEASDEDTLKTHKTSHNNDKLYNCIVCLSKFDKYEELEVHYLSSHTEEQPFECPECEFKCNENATLEYHMKRHSGEKNNKCPFCNQHFVDLDSLKHHITIHISNRMKKDPKDCAVGYNEEAIQHFVDSFLNTDGFSAPFKNGKPVKPKHLQRKQSMPDSPHPGSKPKMFNNLSNNIGTGDNKSLGIKDRKYKAEIFATRYEPEVENDAVKNDLETKLLKHTKVKHTVVVEKLQSRYNHYSSFKVTCFCKNTAVFMNSNIWPSGTLFKWWRNKRINS